MQQLELRYARTPWSRMAGLIGRTSYPPQTALVFERCASVHTWLMRMPIDIVFIDQAWQIMSVHARVEPGQVVREARAYAVLELGAGEAERLALQPGAFVTSAEPAKSA